MINPQETRMAITGTNYLLPAPLPSTWREVESPVLGAACFRHRDGGLKVLAGVEEHPDGKRWLHVSCSRPSRLPSWDDLKAVKNIFVGPHREAYQVLPREEEYVNVHPHTLHLWCWLDGDLIPAFAR